MVRKSTLRLGKLSSLVSIGSMLNKIKLFKKVKIFKRYMGYQTHTVRKSS